MIRLEQLLDVCQRLNESGVSYVLIGGWAIFLHGYERATRDIDILVDDSEDNISALKKALNDLLPEACAELQANDIRQNVVVRMAGENIVLDLIRNVGDMDFARMKTHIEKQKINDVLIPFADLPAMLDLKGGVRDVDQRDYLFLKGKMEYLQRGKK
ncbi:MAG: nucleotidyl transferase AbiEii/AbiGii toxin family protein [Pseudomonadota bacterium]|nr:nucleotidyltransferase [Patescibacteria group bacterium]